jgi:hypothetical protein
MGAWGSMPFENDDALDWLDQLEGWRRGCPRCVDEHRNGLPGSAVGQCRHGRRVITSACQGSPLAELWDDGDGPEWRESFTELSERLQAALR